MAFVLSFFFLFHKRMKFVGRINPMGVISMNMVLFLILRQLFHLYMKLKYDVVNFFGLMKDFFKFPILLITFQFYCISLKKEKYFL